ncbi:hypothetical protein HK099_001557 [Clydaea vesicula]|uniref:Small EDRK-rich factor-like N-terminal domain-containing protein n=1 Tax=Clydaea vesicula TaxID=447962 RepID=A0AAD5U6L7_9FUNG|nr:hypothetical protein HK099_001557 [Clydaea vesicula]KAJ3394485.1 hypothetical protein HDU92_006870 [Lobulomyces angularis]
MKNNASGKGERKDGLQELTPQQRREHDAAKLLEKVAAKKAKAEAEAASAASGTNTANQKKK